uniref:N-acetylneuraminate lyase n=1 Tax=Mycoplasmopsis alligatoris TaxID=47687 RepID=Q6R3F7_9BACT|nr:sialic acid lyase [Mycoplasmopsis alligatoris A21JP2]
MKKYEGIFPALVTPFDKNGKVDHGALEKIVNYLIEKQKVDGIYLTGSTGEFLLLSAQERCEIFKTVAKANKKRVTLIAQVGTLNVDEVEVMTKCAEKLEFDAISAITPYYYGFSFEEVKQYYQKISEFSSLPMFIYYLPQLAGSKLGIEQFGELLRIKNVVGCKFGATDVYMFERLIAKYGKQKVFMFAWDEALASGLLIGAKGFIGSTYNVNALAVREMIDLFNAAKFDKLREKMHVYNDYINAVVSKGLMQTLKAIMRLEGIEAGYNKLPFRKIDEKELEEYAKFIKKEYLM